jgi:hypothetical protein
MRWIGRPWAVGNGARFPGAHPARNIVRPWARWQPTVCTGVYAPAVADDDVRQLVALATDWPAPMRQVFTLRKVYGLCPSIIARRLSLPDEDVERHLIAAALACASLRTVPATSPSGEQPTKTDR